MPIATSRCCPQSSHSRSQKSRMVSYSCAITWHDAVHDARPRHTRTTTTRWAVVVSCPRGHSGRPIPQPRPGLLRAPPLTISGAYLQPHPELLCAPPFTISGVYLRRADGALGAQQASAAAPLEHAHAGVAQRQARGHRGSPHRLAQATQHVPRPQLWASARLRSGLPSPGKETGVRAVNAPSQQPDSMQPG
jgi:hypothetical protein